MNIGVGYISPIASVSHTYINLEHGYAGEYCNAEQSDNLKIGDDPVLVSHGMNIVNQGFCYRGRTENLSLYISFYRQGKFQS